MKVVVGLYQTNCYIIESNGECIIIDPGDEVAKIKKSITKKVIAILITHNHFDHIGALEELKSYYHINSYDINNLEEGKHNIGSFNFEVIYTKGHTLDSISYLFGNDYYVGDFIFKESIGRTDLGGDDALMHNSLIKLKQIKTNLNIYPGHGESTTLDKEKKYNIYLKQV